MLMEICIFGTQLQFPHRSLLIFTTVFIHPSHLTGLMNQTKHPRWVITQQVTCSVCRSGSPTGSTHARTQRVHSPAAHLHLFHFPIVKPGWEGQVFQVKQVKHRYPFTGSWLFSGAPCIRKIIYLLPLFNISAFAQCLQQKAHLLFSNQYGGLHFKE